MILYLRMPFKPVQACCLKAIDDLRFLSKIYLEPLQAPFAGAVSEQKGPSPKGLSGAVARLLHTCPPASAVSTVLWWVLGGVLPLHPQAARHGRSQSHKYSFIKFKAPNSVQEHAPTILWWAWARALSFHPQARRWDCSSAEAAVAGAPSNPWEARSPDVARGLCCALNGSRQHSTRAGFAPHCAQTAQHTSPMELQTIIFRWC